MGVVGGLVTLVGGGREHGSFVCAIAAAGAAAAAGAVADAAEDAKAEDEDGDDDAGYGGPSGGWISDSSRGRIR